MAILNTLNNLKKIGVNNVVKATQTTAKGVGQASRATGNVIMHPGESAVKAGKGIAKSTFKDVKVKEGVDPKNLGNLYTGKKLNPIHLGVAGAGYLGVQSAMQSFDYRTRAPLKLATTNNFQEYGAPDVMSYDGVSQQAAPKNLNANGSLVFGLHNARKG